MPFFPPLSLPPILLPVPRRCRSCVACCWPVLKLLLAMHRCARPGPAPRVSCPTWPPCLMPLLQPTACYAQHLPHRTAAHLRYTPRRGRGAAGPRRTLICGPWVAASLEPSPAASMLHRLNMHACYAFNAATEPISCAEVEVPRGHGRKIRETCSSQLRVVSCCILFYLCQS